jgi:hypothetical protein
MGKRKRNFLKEVSDALDDHLDEMDDVSWATTMC